MTIKDIANEIMEKEAASVPRQSLQQARLVLLNLMKNPKVKQPLVDKMKDVIRFLVSLETTN